MNFLRRQTKLSFSNEDTESVQPLGVLWEVRHNEFSMDFALKPLPHPEIYKKKGYETNLKSLKK